MCKVLNFIFSSSFAGKFKRPPSPSSTVRSSTWDFDSREESRRSERQPSDRPSSRPSGGWRKKQETGNDKGSSPREEQDAGKESVNQEIKPESETDSSSSSEEEVEEKRTVVIPAKKITEKDLNDIGAKIVKAEIMGNEASVVTDNSLTVKSVHLIGFFVSFSPVCGHDPLDFLQETQ